MKKIVLLLLCMASVFAYAQQTLRFEISGKVKNARVFTVDSLAGYTPVTIGAAKITDHTGAFKHQDDALKGVLLTDVLKNMRFDVAGPKQLSQLYFVCVAADGYKVVYSWNELYNTAVGKSVYILTEKNGVKAGDMKESIQMFSAADEKTGRRYLHNLVRIVVGSAE
jgi:hypothetical protein